MLRGDDNSSEPGNSTVFKDERKQGYLDPEGTDRPLISPIPAATLDTARKYRLGRLRAKMKDWNCSASSVTSTMETPESLAACSAAEPLFCISCCLVNWS